MAAADAGVGAGVTAYLPEDHVLVLEFIVGQTQSPEALRRGDKLDQVAAACRRLHGARRFRDDFNMFRIQARYLELVQERGFRLPERYLEFEPQVRAIEAAMAVRDEGTVPCNNDLLAENFIDVGGEFKLIDYEYSGNNDACFELGNVWSESNLALEQLDELVGHYYGRPLRNKVARARLWGLMSKYGWTLWASIQDGVSEIDFDFWEWGMEKYVRAVDEFDGPDFERLLEDVPLARKLSGRLRRGRQALGHCLHHRPSDLRVGLHEGAKLPGAQRVAAQVGLGRHGRRARLIVEETDLAEMVARPERRFRLAVGDHGCGALGDDEESEHPRAALSLSRDHRALGKRVLSQQAGQPLELGPLETREKRHLPEDVDLDPHGPRSYS